MLDEKKAKRTPVRDQEKRPPVNYHILPDKTQDQEPEIEEIIGVKQRVQDKEIPKPAENRVTEAESRQEMPPGKTADSQQVRKNEVHSAIKVAMKSAMPPLRTSFREPVKRPEILPDSAPPDEPGPQDTQDQLQRQPGQEKSDKTPVPDTLVKTPPYCKNCGKKVPPEANFCPMCGIKLGVSSQVRVPKRPSERKTVHKESPVRKKKRTS